MFLFLLFWNISLVLFGKAKLKREAKLGLQLKAKEKNRREGSGLGKLYFTVTVSEWKKLSKNII